MWFSDPNSHKPSSETAYSVCSSHTWDPLLMPVFYVKIKGKVEPIFFKVLFRMLLK